ncbi:MAG: Flp family type IVb pilin [Pseudomonadota bacterium]
MKQLLKQFWQEESGATLVEYAIIVALIAVASIGIISTLQGSINNVFSSISSSLNSAAGTGG